MRSHCTSCKKQNKTKQNNSATEKDRDANHVLEFALGKLYRDLGVVRESFGQYVGRLASVGLLR